MNNYLPSACNFSLNTSPGARIKSQLSLNFMPKFNENESCGYFAVPLATAN